MKRENKSTMVTKHSINENGFLEPQFPTGFFDNSYNLTKALID